MKNINNLIESERGVPTRVVRVVISFLIKALVNLVIAQSDEIAYCVSIR
jgi:hypothetical protein